MPTGTWQYVCPYFPFNSQGTAFSPIARLANGNIVQIDDWGWGGYEEWIYDESEPPNIIGEKWKFPFAMWDGEWVEKASLEEGWYSGSYLYLTGPGFLESATINFEVKTKFTQAYRLSNGKIAYVGYKHRTNWGSKLVGYVQHYYYGHGVCPIVAVWDPDLNTWTQYYDSEINMYGLWTGMEYGSVTDSIGNANFSSIFEGCTSCLDRETDDIYVGITMAAYTPPGHVACGVGSSCNYKISTINPTAETPEFSLLPGTWPGTPIVYPSPNYGFYSLGQMRKGDTGKLLIMSALDMQYPTDHSITYEYDISSGIATQLAVPPSGIIVGQLSNILVAGAAAHPGDVGSSDENVAMIGSVLGDFGGPSPYGYLHLRTNNGVLPVDYGRLPMPFQSHDSWATYRSDKIYFAHWDAGIWAFSPSSDTEPPTCTIESPAPASTVGGLVTVTGGSTDNVELASVRLYVGGSYFGSQTATGTDFDWSIVWNSTLFADGAHTLKACAVDAEGNVGWSTEVSVTVSNTVPVTDTVPPNVTITTPESETTVSWSTAIHATATDDQMLATAQLSVDGAAQGAPLAISGQVAYPAWTFDFSGWANGTHTITVTVKDASGNSASDSVSVTVDNLVASEPKYLYTVPAPMSGESWKLGTMQGLKHMLCVQTGEVPTDPRQRYNVYVGFEATSLETTMGTPSWDNFVPMGVDTAVNVPPNTKQIRWGLKAVPQFSDAYWESALAASFTRIIPTATDGQFYLLASTPPSLWLFNGTTVTKVADFSTLFGVSEARELALSGTKLYVATDLGLVCYDLDSGQLPSMIALESGVCDTIGVQTRSSGSILVHMNSSLYDFTFDATTLLATGCPSGPIYEIGPGIFVGGTNDPSNNGIYLYSDGAWVQQVATSDKVVNRICRTESGGVISAWYAVGNTLYFDTPSLSLDATFDPSAVPYVVSQWLDSVVALGDLGGIWRRGGDGNWSLFRTLEYLDVARDVLVYNGVLYAVGTSAGAKATIEAMFVDEGGQFVCGPIPPDVHAQVLQYTDVTEAE